MVAKIDSKGTQMQGKVKQGENVGKSRGPCLRLCNMIPTNVPEPGAAQAVLHPRKDVFVLKVSISNK